MRHANAPSLPIAGRRLPAAPAAGDSASRWGAVMGALALAFLAVSGQLVRLAIKGQGDQRIAVAEPVARTVSRPDIVDRNGRLIATDVEAQSLYADPALILDVEEAAERLGEVLPELDQADLRRQLSEAGRRFVWIRRGLSPALAQRIHDLGIPGLAFRREPRRVYPAGSLAGHVLGRVDVDNRGVAGIERWIDETIGVEALIDSAGPARPPVRLSLDVGAQHGLERELAGAVERYRTAGAAGVVLDAGTGDVIAAASLPSVDPGRPSQGIDPVRLDRLTTGTYELGSIFKTVTVALALETGTGSLDKVYDVRAPLRVGGFAIRDSHPSARPLTLREVFVHSSNIGAGMIALESGAQQQRALLARLGLTEPMRTEAGPLGAPQLPERWGPTETATIAFGHGIAVAPLQFAAAAATLVNGGRRVAPTFIAGAAARAAERRQVIAPATSAAVAELMRRNVIDPAGTGRRADVAGYEVGGKTGTAELASARGYRQHAVISSFLAAFPASAPRYVALVMLFEPQPTAETKGQITAGLNAAPTMGRLIERIGPLLDVAPR